MIPFSFRQFPASPSSDIIIGCISIANTQNNPFEIVPIASGYILASPKGKIIISCIENTFTQIQVNFILDLDQKL